MASPWAELWDGGLWDSTEPWDAIGRTRVTLGGDLLASSATRGDS